MTDIENPESLEKIDWDESIEVDNEEVYASLLRAIQRTEGFGLFFVRCVEKDRISIQERLQKDLPRLTLANLELTEELTDGNLYRRVKAIRDNKSILDALFISGLEKSLDPYVKSGYGGLGDYYNKDIVPRVLGHLNLQRERFRDDFPFCLIFFLSAFGIKFIARRAPDFFDWRSGLFEFIADSHTIDQLTQSIYGDFSEYIQWSVSKRINRVREIQALIDEDYQTKPGKAALFLEKGNILVAGGSYEEAIASYDKALEIKTDKDEAWYNRGISLANLGRYEEAIASYDKALEIKTDKDNAWINRGISLDKLERYEEAIASYDKALEIKTNDYRAWYNRGISLNNLGRYEEAIDSYGTALEIKTNNHKACLNQGLSLANLGRYEEAIAAYNKALEIKTDYYAAWYSRGRSLANLGQYEEAIDSFDKALKLKSDDPNTIYNRACAYALQGSSDLALEDLAQAIQMSPEQYKKLATSDEDFISIRNDPRFQKLIESESSSDSD